MFLDRVRVARAVLVLVVAIAAGLRVAGRHTGGEPGIGSFMVMSLAAMGALLLAPAADRRFRGRSDKD